MASQENESSLRDTAAEVFKVKPHNIYNLFPNDPAKKPPFRGWGESCFKILLLLGVVCTPLILALHSKAETGGSL